VRAVYGRPLPFRRRVRAALPFSAPGVVPSPLPLSRTPVDGGSRVRGFGGRTRGLPQGCAQWRPERAAQECEGTRGTASAAATLHAQGAIGHTPVGVRACGRQSRAPATHHLRECGIGAKG
jgi:hypothetical protein